MNHLNGYYNFVINEYKSARHNLMRNEGFIKYDQIPHKYYKILDNNKKLIFIHRYDRKGEIILHHIHHLLKK